MNTRPFPLSAFCLLLAGSISLPVVLRADDMAGSNAPAATPATAPMAQPAVVQPSPTAAGNTTPTPPAPAESNPATYTMVAGDTLDSVAKKFGTSIHALAKLNHIPKSMFRKLRAGKVLQIPATTAAATGAK